MRYFVTLNDREFPLRLERGANAEPRVWALEPQATIPAATAAAAAGTPRTPPPPSVASTERALQAELLSPAQHGRPALVRVDGRVFRVRIETAAALGARQARVNGEAFRIALETELARRARPAPSAARASGTRIVAPMPGRVVKVNVNVGDRVAAGAALLSVEAMKMENELQSPGAGRVVSVRVQVGATVESDQELVVLAPEP